MDNNIKGAVRKEGFDNSDSEAPSSTSRTMNWGIEHSSYFTTVTGDPGTPPQHLSSLWATPYMDIWIQ